MSILNLSSAVYSQDPRFAAVVAFDNFFSFSNTRYQITDSSGKKNSHFVTKVDIKQNVALTILKVIGMMTIIVPLIMGIGKLIARSQFEFLIRLETSVLSRGQQDTRQTQSNIQTINLLNPISSVNKLATAVVGNSQVQTEIACDSVKFLAIQEIDKILSGFEKQEPYQLGALIIANAQAEPQQISTHLFSSGKKMREKIANELKERTLFPKDLKIILLLQTSPKNFRFLSGEFAQDNFEFTKVLLGGAQQTRVEDYLKGFIEADISDVISHFYPKLENSQRKSEEKIPNQIPNPTNPLSPVNKPDLVKEETQAAIDHFKRKALASLNQPEGQQAAISKELT